MHMPTTFVQSAESWTNTFFHFLGPSEIGSCREKYCPTPHLFLHWSGYMNHSPYCYCDSGLTLNTTLTLLFSTLNRRTSPTMAE